MKKIIQTPFGETVLNIFGKGPPILVVHGGPGFSHDYLVKGLLPIAEKRTMIFYDQPTDRDKNKESKNFSHTTVFSHFRWLANEFSNKNPVGIIAHSWGVLVVIAGLTETSLQKSPSPNLSKILFLNPMPVTAQALKGSRRNLMNRMSWLSMIRLVFLIAINANGQKIMKELLPYYVSDRSLIPQEGFKFDKQTYLKILQQLKFYDLLNRLPALPKFNLLLSEQDFITSSHLAPLIKVASDQFIIKNSVHFPMWENPKDFQKVIQSFFLDK